MTRSPRASGPSSRYFSMTQNSLLLLSLWIKVSQKWVLSTSMLCEFYNLDTCTRAYMKMCWRLFDMDGTLVDSTQGVVGAWKTFANAYPGIDVHEILSSQYYQFIWISRIAEALVIASHGVRTVENLRVHCGITDPDLLEVCQFQDDEAIY